MSALSSAPDQLTAPFWESARRRELVRPVCDECGRSFFSPQIACPHCHSTSWQYMPSSGRGVVSSHTTVHRPPEPSFVAPYVLAIVDMDEGWSLLTRLLVDPPTDSLIGAAVVVAFTPDPVVPERMLPTFALTRSPVPNEVL